MTKLLHRWRHIVIACITLASVASAERLTTFFWDAVPTWPVGTTVELCGNGPTCLTGLSGPSATLSLPVQPGEVIQGRARAIPPPGYQCGQPMALCPPSEWATVAQTWPLPPVAPWAWKTEESQMAIAYGGFTYVAGSASGGDSFTGPVISGTDTYLLVGIVVNGLTESIPSSVTYDGVSMGTPLVTIRGADYNRIAVYGLVNPSSAKTIAYSGVGGFIQSAAFAVYYTGVNQSTPTRTATTAGGTSSPATVDITNSQSNDLLVGFFGTDDASLANSFTEARMGAGQTYRASIANTSDEALIAFCEEPGAVGTVTTSWAYAGGYGWSEVVIPLVPTSSGSAATALPRRAIDGPLVGALRGSVR